jgi:hypothetical protein
MCQSRVLQESQGELHERTPFHYFDQPNRSQGRIDSDINYTSLDASPGDNL